MSLHRLECHSSQKQISYAYRVNEFLKIQYNASFYVPIKRLLETSLLQPNPSRTWTSNSPTVINNSFMRQQSSAKLQSICINHHSHSHKYMKYEFHGIMTDRKLQDNIKVAVSDDRFFLAFSC